MLVSQIMAVIKSSNNSAQEINDLVREDAYWAALLNDEEKVDFLSKESFAMNNFVLLLNNLCTSIFAMEMIWPDVLKRYWMIMLTFLTINVFTLVYFIHVIYKGTTKE